MMTGVGVCFLCSLVYPILSTVSGFLLLRLVHGFSTGFTPTGQSAYLSDIIPIHKRGEAMGLLGTAGTLGMAAGPAAGGSIANSFGLHAMFYCTSFLALMSVVILIGIKETLEDKKRFSFGMLEMKKDDLFEPLVVAPLCGDDSVCLCLWNCVYCLTRFWRVCGNKKQRIAIYFLYDRFFARKGFGRKSF